jgi:hypothetical protein
MAAGVRHRLAPARSLAAVFLRAGCELTRCSRGRFRSAQQAAPRSVATSSREHARGASARRTLRPAPVVIDRSLKLLSDAAAAKPDEPEVWLFRGDTASSVETAKARLPISSVRSGSRRLTPRRTPRSVLRTCARETRPRARVSGGRSRSIPINPRSANTSEIRRARLDGDLRH